jgi:ABC-type multidrug transport system ATPase subunit
VLITDHAAREILQIVDRCYVISEGKVLCHGAPDEIKQHAEVRRKYLGDLDGAGVGPPPPHTLKRRERPSASALSPRRYASIHEQDTLDADP